jgi:hypothetical protein
MRRQRLQQHNFFQVNLCIKGYIKSHSNYHALKIQSINNVHSTVESRDYAPPFCMLALGKSGEGAYTRDRDISA